MDKLKTIKNELAGLINSHSLENGSNTPDFILAAYLLNCLAVFDHANNWNTAWHSKDGVPVDWRENGPPTAVRAHDAGTVSTAQLDAEDQHRASEQVTGEPTSWSAQDHTEEYVQQGYITEPVVERMVDVSCEYAREHLHWNPDTDSQSRRNCISMMIPALAVAREGYYSLEAVEKALNAGRCQLGFLKPVQLDEVVADLKRRLAPKPEPDPAVEAVAKLLFARSESHLCGHTPEEIVEAVRKSDAAERRTK